MTDTNLALADAINGLPDPFIAFDANDAVTAFNRAAAALLGDLTGLSCSDVEQRWGDMAREPEAAKRALSSAYSNPGGRPQRLLGSSAVFAVRCQTTGTGKALMFRRGGLTDLAPTLEDEMMLEQGRANFINLMSHALRTPLNSVLGFSEIISLQALGPDAQDRYREYAKDIATEAIRLHESLDALLTLASLESEDGVIRSQVFNAGALVQSAIASVKTTNENAVVNYDAPEGLVQGRGDPELIHQAMTAIISECLRASENQELTAAIVARGGSIVFTLQLPHSSEEALKQATDAQFNTGLWIGHTIASAHGGGLRLTKPNQGKREIRLVLPQ